MARFSIGKNNPAIALLTDFGFRDSYVGVMKGVIRTVCRGAEIIDRLFSVITHFVLVEAPKLQREEQHRALRERILEHPDGPRILERFDALAS